MRAPTKQADGDGRARFTDVCLTDEQSRKIRKSLEAVGIDPDAVIVDTGLGEWPLLEGLPLIATDCDIAARLLKESRPPKWVAKNKFSDTIELCKDLLARLDDPGNYNRVDPYTHDLQFPNLSSQAHRCRAELVAFVAELERCRETLAGMGGRHGPRELHIRFWKALRQVWEANVRDGTDKRLLSFLIACTEPFFPEAATDSVIIAFIERPSR